MRTQSGYPGYGIVYPQGSTSGFKVTRICSHGSKKIRHADGSYEHIPPYPTIMELVGGAFCYASGQIVNKREDLEHLPPQMKEMALQWFDSKRVIPKEAVVDIPEPAERTEPDARWIMSNERPDLLDSDGVQKDIDSATKAAPPAMEESAIMSALNAIMDKLNKHDKDIETIKHSPPPPRRMALSEAKHSKQSETMKKKWADPAYKAKMLERRSKNNQEATDGGRTPETDKSM
jgi:hypothetical protein